MNVIAISATIFMCMNGPVVRNTCDDGSAPFAATVNILSGTSHDDCKLDWTNLRGCVNEWESVIDVLRDGNLLLRVTPTGKLITNHGFSPDKGAEAFFHATALLINNIK